MPEDLRDTGRLLELHEQAVEQKLVTTSEADRLKFVAGAEHAKAVGSKPCRLFAWMAAEGRWEFITQADEDAARSRLRELRGVRREDPPARPGVSRPPPLSEDALLVRSVRRRSAEPAIAATRSRSSAARSRSGPVSAGTWPSSSSTGREGGAEPPAG